MGFWSRSPPAVTHEYQQSVAHRVRDILTGVDHTTHSHRDKVAIKALQRPEALAGVIEILKTMPEPCPRKDGWEVDEGGSDVKSNPTVIVAATTIAAAAATSAAAATLAISRGKKVNEAGQVEEEVVGDDGTVTKTVTTTVVRFIPSKTTVSSHAYWWGYEIFIPQDALSRIASAQDVSSAFLGFLGSVGLVVPSIVPFLGYIAAYVGLEFTLIKAQNEGKGVILASTWLVPVALVPRAWDAPDEDDENA
ncbi:hypothetical protein BGZ80_000550 [Entomortierella chlamydospora]|uniref:Uncharacterized protein n=1 Tax=Entomortierella chlamydospora TaxID=101097 RepID=A0A9P6MT77_9FUNG|nr:hypothetical protein BGZ80_000550 [Entomortierella chlamydospora]